MFGRIFGKRRGRKPRGRPFLYPIQPVPRAAVLVPRTAVLIPGFRSQDPIRIFENGWCEEARAFEPRALAGTLAQIDALGNDLPHLTHALIVLRAPGEALFTEPDRDRLWKTFRVPLFEYIVDRHGEILAAECEAHEGLHVLSSRLDVKDRVDAPCPCGKKTPRIGVPDRQQVIRKLVAYAR